MSTDAIANSSSPFKLKIVTTTGQCYSIGVAKSECPIILSAQFYVANTRCICGIGTNTANNSYIIYFHQFQSGQSTTKDVALGAGHQIYIIYTE